MALCQRKWLSGFQGHSMIRKGAATVFCTPSRRQRKLAFSSQVDSSGEQEGGTSIPCVEITELKGIPVLK